MADYVCEDCLLEAERRWLAFLVEGVKPSITASSERRICEYCGKSSARILRVGMAGEKPELVFRPEYLEFFLNPKNVVGGVVHTPPGFFHHDNRIQNKEDALTAKELATARKEQARTISKHKLTFYRSPNVLYRGRYSIQCILTNESIQDLDFATCLLIFPDDLTDVDIVVLEQIDLEASTGSIIGWTTPKEIAAGEVELLQFLHPLRELERFGIRHARRRADVD